MLVTLIQILQINLCLQGTNLVRPITTRVQGSHEMASLFLIRKQLQLGEWSQTAEASKQPKHQGKRRWGTPLVWTE